MRCAVLWVQAGRAGRREQPSLSIYVGFDGPLDQHFMRHPHELFSKPVEAAQVRLWACMRAWVHARVLLV